MEVHAPPPGRGNRLGQLTTVRRCTTFPSQETKPVSTPPTTRGIGVLHGKYAPEPVPPVAALPPPAPFNPPLPAAAETQRPSTQIVPGQPKQFVCGQSALVLH
jgi:hypothetical protein